MKRFIWKVCLVTFGCFFLFRIIIRLQPPKKFIPSTMNFSNVNILRYMEEPRVDKVDVATGAEEVIENDRNIFFLETGHIRDSNQINLNARQGCAVESAALTNPEMKIYLFIFINQFWNYSDRTQTIITQLNNYKNVIIRHIYLEQYLENSPMDEWWNFINHITASKWSVTDITDALKYLTLWKFGGIYLDLDVIMKESLEFLEDFAASESAAFVTSSVLGFHLTDVGRRYANECLFEFMTNYQSDAWGINGARVITSILKKNCHTENISEMNADRCGGFTVFPPSTFSPIPPKNWERYFNHKKKRMTMNMINKAMAIHIWNNQSRLTPVEIGNQVPYELTAAKYCPRVYKTSGLNF